MKYIIGFILGLAFSGIVFFSLVANVRSTGNTVNKATIDSISGWIQTDRINIKQKYSEMLKLHLNWQDLEMKSDPSVFMLASDVRSHIFFYRSHVDFYELQFHDGTKYTESDKGVLQIIDAMQKRSNEKSQNNERQF